MQEISFKWEISFMRKRFILTVLQDSKGNQCKAARELGITATPSAAPSPSSSSTPKDCAAAPGVRRVALTTLPSINVPPAREAFSRLH